MPQITWSDEELAVVKDAGDLIEAGWCQRAYHRLIDGKPCYCAHGALYKAIAPDHPAPWNISGGKEGSAIILRFFEIRNKLCWNLATLQGTTNLILWNDMPETTKTQVLEVFRAPL